MTYIGIGYSGDNPLFLREMVNVHNDWLKSDRLPRFFGDTFLVMYDSNTAREFAGKCKEAIQGKGKLVIYPMGKPYSQTILESRD